MDLVEPLGLLCIAPLTLLLDPRGTRISLLVRDVFGGGLVERVRLPDLDLVTGVLLVDLGRATLFVVGGRLPDLGFGGAVLITVAPL
jgi:hypothetical protein